MLAYRLSGSLTMALWVDCAGNWNYFDVENAELAAACKRKIAGLGGHQLLSSIYQCVFSWKLTSSIMIRLIAVSVCFMTSIHVNFTDIFFWQQVASPGQEILAARPDPFSDAHQWQRSWLRKKSNAHDLLHACLLTPIYWRQNLAIYQAF